MFEDKYNMEKFIFDVKYGMKLWFTPVVVILSFFGIFAELLRQMFICSAMRSEEFRQLQDLKLRDEEIILSQKQEELELEK